MSNYVFLCAGVHSVDPTIDMRAIGLTDVRPADSVISSRFSWPEVIEIYSGDNPPVAFRAAALRHSGCAAISETPICRANAWSITYTNLHGPENILAGLSLWEYRPVVLHGWLVNSNAFELRLIARYWAIRTENPLQEAEKSALKGELEQAESRAALASVRVGAAERELEAVHRAIMMKSVECETASRLAEKLRAELAAERDLTASLTRLHTEYKEELARAYTAREASARADLEVARLTKLAAADYSEIQSLRGEIQVIKRSLADRVAEIESARKQSPNRAPPPKNQPAPAPRDTLASAILAFDRSGLKKTAVNIETAECV